MLDPVHLLVASATVERGISVLVAGMTVAIGVRAVWRGVPAARVPLRLGPSAERAAMGVVVAWVLVTRLVGSTSPQQPRVYYAQASVVFIADALAAGDPGRRWLAQLRNTQVLMEHESPIQAPVAAVLQRVLGPSIELPTFIGAFWGLLAVILAWRLGRVIESPAFGVVFAALVAISPLQLAWARIGGIHIGAPAAVLFALWTGWLVGSRGGALAALLLGLVAWSSVYFYFAARVGMVLAPVALWSSWLRSGRGGGRLAWLLAWVVIGLGACMLLAGAGTSGHSLWPTVQGYVGTRGETGLRDWIASVASVARAQLRLSLSSYFWRDRVAPVVLQVTGFPSHWTGTLLQAGMSGGALVLLPVLLLGCVGLVRCVRHPRERVLWLVLAVAGAMPPLLSVPAARRYLVFDIGWCAFAAFGMLALVESGLLPAATSSRRWGWAALVLAGVGVWSAATVAITWAVLPFQQAHIPFAESGFGDGSTCLGCIDTAREWQHEMDEGRMVVLVDSDVFRENRTMPGGLSLYGKTVALAARRPAFFFDYYAIASNFDEEPPRPGPVTPTPTDDVVRAIGARIEAAKPRAVVWWFSQPNAWERRLADVLTAAGSSRTTPAARPVWGADRSTVAVEPIRVETPWGRRDAALGALRGFLDGESPPPCVRLQRVAAAHYGKPPLVLAPIDTAGDGPPHWAVGSFDMVEVWGGERAVMEPEGLEYERGNGGRRVHAVDLWGNARLWTEIGEERHADPAPGPRPLGRDCVALHDERWWVVDPVAGTVHVAGNMPAAVPAGVIGVTRLGDQPVLATADQRLFVLDATAREIVRSFPATVAPARRFHFGECAMLAAGDGWVASLDQNRGLLFLYHGDGTPLGRLPLARSVGTEPRAVHAIRGNGDYLGVGHDLSVTTFRVVWDPACSRPGRTADEPGAAGQ